MSSRSRLTRLGAIVALVLGFGVLTTSPAAASQCTYDTVARTLTVALSASDSYTQVRANAPYLDIADVHCALLTEVNSVAIDATSRPNALLEFNLTYGPLGPGYLIEADGSSEIEFTIAGMSNAGTVSVQGAAGNDVIRAGQYFNKTTGVLTGQLNLNGAADGATQDVDVSFTSFPGLIQLLGNDGDDTLSAAGAGVAFTGPLSIPASMRGGMGANTTTGGNGNDSLYFQEEGAGDAPDVLAGGGGSDTVFAITSGPATTGSITLDGVANDGAHCPGATCNGDFVGADIENAAGSNSAETIVGNDLAQTLRGGGGNDVVIGGGAADVVDCGGGSATGGGGGDTLLVSSSHCDNVHGDKGRDTVSFVIAPSGLGVTVSADNVPGDGYTGWGTNVHSDIEVIRGTPNADVLSGNDRRNTLEGGNGSDQLYGLGGSDTLDPGTGLDSVAGGGGADTLNYGASPLPVVVNVASGLVTGEGDDAFTGVESFAGSPLADTMTGAGGVDRFFGAAGNDTLSGRGGNDILNGGDGDDVIDGGPGTDVCSQGAGAGSVVNCE